MMARYWKLLVFFGVFLGLMVSVSFRTYAQDIATPSATPSVQNLLDILDTIDLSAIVNATPAADASASSPLDQIVQDIETKGMVSSATLRKPSVVRDLPKSAYFAGEAIDIRVNNAKESDLDISVKGVHGNAGLVDIVKTQTSDGVFVRLMPKESFLPGKYDISLTDSLGLQKTVGVWWGTVLINFDKFVYEAQDRPNLSMTVLGEDGNPVCQGRVTIHVSDPLGKSWDYETTTGGTVLSGTCTGSTAVAKTLETATTFGKYAVRISIATEEGSYEVFSSFKVGKKETMSIRRIAETSVRSGSSVGVTLEVRANEDVGGYLVDRVPGSFATETLGGTTAPESITLGSGVNEQRETQTLRYPFEGAHPVLSTFGGQPEDLSLLTEYKRYGIIGNDGTDFDLPLGTPILAAADGKVALISDVPYGKTVVIDHGWGKTYYGYLGEVNVSDGQEVSVGEEIAVSGQADFATPKERLHFALKLSDNNPENGYFGKIDPMPYLTSTSFIVGGAEAKELLWSIHLKAGQTATLGYRITVPGTQTGLFSIGGVSSDIQGTALGQWQAIATDGAKREENLSASTEYVPMRNEFSKTFVNPDGTITTQALMGPVNYKDESGNWEEIDALPLRVTDETFDGWEVTRNTFHFRVGRRNGEDGWIGYGGKNGKDWFWFRLENYGYMDWDTKQLTNLSLSPEYRRERLSIGAESLEDADGGMQNIEGSVHWDDLWSGISARWVVDGGRLKEEVVLDAPARERLITSPDGQTHFGFIFEADWNDVARIISKEKTIDVNSDFELSQDSGVGSSAALQDDVGDFLGFLPLDIVYVEGAARRSPIPSRITLDKWFFDDENGVYGTPGKNYLFVGAPVSELQGLQEGNLVFDPSVQVDVDDDARDAFSEGNVYRLNPTAATFDAMYFGYAPGDFTPGNLDPGFIFLSTIPQGASVSVCTVRVVNGADNNGTVVGSWYGYDVDSVANFSAGESGRVSDHATRTASSVSDNFAGAGNHTSPDLSTPCDAVVNRAGFTGTLGLTWRNTSASGNQWYQWLDFADGAANAPRLNATYTTASATPALDQLLRHGEWFSSNVRQAFTF